MSAAGHDPFVYAYMRACGAPRSQYYSYMRQLGFYSRVPRNTHPKRTPAPPTFPPWVTPAVRKIAAQYRRSKHQPALTPALHAVEAVLADIVANSAQRDTTNLKRRLLHAQAKLWTAIGEGIEGDDPLTPLQISTIYNFLNPRTNAKARYLERLRLKKQLLDHSEYLTARDQYHEAWNTYRQAKARLRVATAAKYDARNEARMVGGWKKRTPRAAQIAYHLALAEYQVAKTQKHHRRVLLLRLVNKLTRGRLTLTSKDDIMGVLRKEPFSPEGSIALPPLG